MDLCPCTSFSSNTSAQGLLRCAPKRTIPTFHQPAYVRSENKEPASVLVHAKVGNNTYLDQRSRLRHESDVSPAGPQPAPLVLQLSEKPELPKVAVSLEESQAVNGDPEYSKGPEVSGLPPHSTPMQPLSAPHARMLWINPI